MALKSASRTSYAWVLQNADGFIGTVNYYGSDCQPSITTMKDVFAAKRFTSRAAAEDFMEEELLEHCCPVHIAHQQQITIKEIPE